MKMGRISADATTMLHSPEGNFSINPKAPKVVNLDADIGDLGWTSLFLDDSMELCGAVHAKVELVCQTDGSWRSTGTIAGQKIQGISIHAGIPLRRGPLSP